jgi:hypothetical protein
MTVTRRRFGRNGYAWYMNGVKVPGVTQVTRMLPSQNLIDWAANTTADYAIDHLKQLTEMAPSVALNTLKRARYEVTDPAKRRGTEVHKIAEPAIRGEPVRMDLVPLELRGYVEAYMDFLDAVNPAPVAVELPIGSKKHRYCGQTDLIADLPPVSWDGQVLPADRWLLDLKTGEKGVYPEAALQLCGYQHGDLFVPPEDPGEERPLEWLKIGRCGVVHLSSDAWELRPVETGPEVWKFFQYLLWMHKKQDAMKQWIGSPIEPIAAELAEVL